tara:strand:+ start:2522 stop:2677 length:156 start_codon:yes stop_codon:yes gene_type:complete
MPDVRPMSHELRNVYITGDRKVFLDRDEAKKHQEYLEYKSKYGIGEKETGG